MVEARLLAGAIGCVLLAMRCHTLLLVYSRGILPFFVNWTTNGSEVAEDRRSENSAARAAIDFSRSLHAPYSNAPQVLGYSCDSPSKETRQYLRFSESLAVKTAISTAKMRSAEQKRGQVAYMMPLKPLHVPRSTATRPLTASPRALAAAAALPHPLLITSHHILHVHRRLPHPPQRPRHAPAQPAVAAAPVRHLPVPAGAAGRAPAPEPRQGQAARSCL